MTKEIKTIKNITCDNCKKKTEYDTVELSFGYPSNFDEKQLDFCSDKCLKEWVNKNIHSPAQSEGDGELRLSSPSGDAKEEVVD